MRVSTAIASALLVSLSLGSSTLAQQAAVEAAPAAPPAGQAASKDEERQTLATFYAMQLLIGECNVKVGARDQARLKKVLTLMEIGTSFKPAELAQIKGSVLTEISTDKEKSCSAGRIQLATLGPVLDEMNKQLGGLIDDSAQAQAPPAASPKGQRTAAAEPASGGSLSGLAAIQAMVGNTIFAKVDGVTYYDHLLPDGTLKNLEDSTVSVGKWTIEGNRYCTSYKGYSKTCYAIEMAGSDVTLTEKNGQGWRYKLLQGNPKKL